MAWLSGWQYRKSHVINSANGAGTNYQVKVKVYYGSGTDSGENVYLNGKCKTDFGDIRFTGSDGETLLDYWMESKTDSDNAVFWVEVADDLSSNNATIYIYYGKATATTTSNGTATFQSFRNLVADEYASLGAVSLTTYGDADDPGDYFLSSTQVGTVYLSPCIYFRYYGGEKWSLDSTKIHFEGYLSGGNYGECGQEIRMRTSAAPAGWQVSNAYTANTTLDRKHILVIDHQMLSGSGVLIYFSTWYVGDDIPYGTIAKSTTLSSATRVKIEDVYMDSVSHIKIVVGTGASIDLYAVYHCVAKYVSPEPSHGSWGSEETGGAVTRVVVEYVGLLDSRFKELGRNIKEYIGLFESKSKKLSKMFSDYIGLLDLTSKIHTLRRTFTEYVGLLESSIHGTAGYVYRMVTEYISLLDSKIRTVNLHRSFIEQLGMLESKVKFLSKTFIEYIGLYDFIERRKITGRIITEFVGLKDAVNERKHLIRVFIEYVAVMETRIISKVLHKIIVEYLGVKEKYYKLPSFFKFFKWRRFQHPKQRVEVSS